MIVKIFMSQGWSELRQFIGSINIVPDTQRTPTACVANAVNILGSFIHVMNIYRPFTVPWLLIGRPFYYIKKKKSNRFQSVSRMQIKTESPKTFIQLWFSSEENRMEGEFLSLVYENSRDRRSSRIIRKKTLFQISVSAQKQSMVQQMNGKVTNYTIFMITFFSDYSRLEERAFLFTSKCVLSILFTAWEYLY